MLYSNILVAYDGSEMAERALEAGARLAALSEGARLEVLHVFYLPALVVGEAFVTVPAELGKEEYDYAESLEAQARTRLAALGVTNGEVTTRQGSPAKTILDYAAERGSDLIVMGSRGLGSISEFVLGSVSHNVVQHARVPVLVVK